LGGRPITLKLRDLHVFYGPIEAVRGVSLDIRKGEIVCLLGSNGAGKSTTLMTISGVLRPKNGAVLFEGKDISGIPPHEIVRMGISHVPEGRRIFPKLTVRENLDMGAGAGSPGGGTATPPIGLRQGATSPGGRHGLPRKGAELERVFELFPVLKERQAQPGGTLSGGEQQMLAIGRALMSGPKLLLLDEPSLGLSPILVSKIFKTIKEINAGGVTVLLVEQNARAALGLSGRGYVLEAGRVALSGTGAELLHNEQVKKAYLGEA